MRRQSLNVSEKSFNFSYNLGNLPKLCFAAESSQLLESHSNAELLSPIVSMS